MRCFNKPFHLFPNVTHSAAAAVVACGGCFFLPTPQDPLAAGPRTIFPFRPPNPIPTTRRSSDLFPNVTPSAAAAVVACGGCFFLPTPQDPVAAGIGIIFTFRPQTLSNRLLRTCEALVPRRFRPYPLTPSLRRPTAPPPPPPPPPPP